MSTWRPLVARISPITAIAMPSRAPSRPKTMVRTTVMMLFVTRSRTTPTSRSICSVVSSAQSGFVNGVPAMRRL